MIELFRVNYLQYKWIILLGLALQIIGSVMTVGYHNPDEHWQLYEFAAYKLGLSDASVMPWEFHRQARQTIQPLIVYGLSKSMMVLHCFNPFTVALILRLLSGILAWGSALLIVFQARPHFSSEKIYKWSILSVNFLWYIPYIHARFQSENWAGIFMALGVFHALLLFDKRRSAPYFIITGLLLGMAFNCRYQIGFSLVALGVWLLIFKKMNFPQLSMLALGFLIMIGVEMLSDYWYYGSWIFMPYRYFYIQLIEGVSNGWGVYPWWYYFELFINYNVVPLSIFLLAMLMISSFSYPTHLFTWIIWAFVLGHNLNGYKEIRYLYPLIPYFCVLLFLAFNKSWVEAFLSRINPKVLKIALAILLIENFALLIVSTLKPANEAIGFLSKVYDYSDKKITLYCIGKDPYDWGGIKYNFYRPQNITVLPFDSTSFGTRASNPDLQILVFNEGFELQPQYEKYQLANVYKTVPDWLKYFNINNWLSRTRVWGLYKKANE